VTELGSCPELRFRSGPFGGDDDCSSTPSELPSARWSSCECDGPSRGRRDSVEPLFLRDRVGGGRSSSNRASSTWRRAIWPLSSLRRSFQCSTEVQIVVSASRPGGGSVASMPKTRSMGSCRGDRGGEVQEGAVGTIEARGYIQQRFTDGQPWWRRGSRTSYWADLRTGRRACESIDAGADRQRCSAGGWYCTVLDSGRGAGVGVGEERRSRVERVAGAG
jgi:hypothetical protein